MLADLDIIVDSDAAFMVCIEISNMIYNHNN